MHDQTIVYGSSQLHAASATPRVHCDHDDGTLSLALTPAGDHHAIYLMGTASDLLDLAAKIVAAVPLVETGRTIGECLTELDARGYVRSSAELTGDNPDNVYECSGCGADLTHDCARYYYCANTQCDAYRHTILMGADGTRSVVGMIR